MAYKTPKEVQERKDAKRKHILMTAAKVFAGRGYHDTTVKDIVDEAGVSVGSFYFYFKNKEELFETLYDETTGILIEAVESNIYNNDYSAVEKACCAIYSALSTFERNREFARILMIEGVGLNKRFEDKRTESNERIIGMIEQSLRISDEKGDISFPDYKIAAIAYSGAVFSVIGYWLQSEEKQQLTDYTFPLTLFILQALNKNIKEDDISDCIRSIRNKN